MKLIGKNIKGSTFEHELAQVTIFTGRNYKGKTTRIETAMLALAGYVPGVSEKQNVIFEEFASAPKMTTMFSVNEGVAALREWEMLKGKVKYEECLHESFESFPRIAIDYTEFFGLSGPERAKFLFARAKLSESMTIEAFKLSITAKLKTSMLAECTAQTEKAIVDIVDYIAGRQRVTPQEWLTNLLVDAKVKLNAAVATTKRMESTLQGMTLVTGEASTVPPDCEAKRNEARSRLDIANEARTTITQQLNTAREEYRVANNTAKQWKDDTQDRATLVEIEKQKNVVFVACSGEIPDIGKATEASTTAKEAWSKTINEGLNPHYDRVKELTAQIAAAKKPGVCDHCGQKTKANPKLAAELKKLLVTEKAREEGLKQAQRDTCKTMNETGENLTAAITANDVRNVHQKKFRELSHQHETIRQGLSFNDAAHAAKMKLPALEETGRALAIKLTDAETLANNIAVELDVYEAQVRDLSAERGKAQQRALVIEDCAKSRAESAVLKELCSLLADLQAKLLDEVIGPLIAKINEYCGGLLRAPLGYKDGEISFVDVAHGHKTMSGTEKTIFYAAASAALAQDAPLKIILLDEFDIDELNWDKLVMLLSDLCVRGKLDCALLAHTTAPNVHGENVKVIPL